MGLRVVERQIELEPPVSCKRVRFLITYKVRTYDVEKLCDLQKGGGG